MTIIFHNVNVMYIFCTQNCYECTNFVHIRYVQNVYKICYLYTKCANICTKYIQTGCYGGVSFEQNHHHRLDKIECYCHITITQSHKINIFLTKCIHSCFSTYNVVTKYDNYISQCKCHVHILYTKL